MVFMAGITIHIGVEDIGVEDIMVTIHIGVPDIGEVPGV